MKSDHPVITLLGNNSGRNLGDMAIMSSVLESLSKRLPGAEFYVPSIAPNWTDTNYGKRYNVKGINVMPWTGSIRLLGIPTLRCLAKSDIALICDGIIFGKKLFNPAFNYLITLIFLVPLARLLGCKIVCYSCGIGPFPSWISKVFGRWVIQGSDLIMMRERDSEALCKEIGVTKPIELTGDAAFINPVSSDERAVEIVKSLGLNPSTELLALNVTKYMDQWLKPEERLASGQSFLKTLADGVNMARTTLSNGFEPLVICTQPMDEGVCTEFAKLVNGKLLSNSKYLSHDIQAVMRRCGLLMGMRFHSVVLAQSVETPVVGLIYAPKVRGYMRLVKCEEYSLELAGLTSATIASKLVSAWNTREELRNRQRSIINDLKAGAERAADLIVSRYYPDFGSANSKAA